jgi:hypothetical protein
VVEEVLDGALLVEELQKQEVLGDPVEVVQVMKVVQLLVGRRHHIQVQHNKVFQVERELQVQLHRIEEVAVAVVQANLVIMEVHQIMEEVGMDYQFLSQA